VQLQILRYATLPSMPWKNGLGRAKQLAIHPPRATAEAFEWRLSIAELTGTAPFSRFPGITRSLAVLEGTLTLQWRNGEVEQLNPHSAPLEFAGEDAVTGSVQRGRALDLNLMWQHARWYAVMTRLTAQAGARQLQRFTGTFMVCSLVEQLPLRIAHDEHVLGRYDLLWFEDSDARPGARLEAGDQAGFDAYCIELQPR
jgi:uncharacterized protein